MANEGYTSQIINSNDNDDIYDDDDDDDDDDSDKLNNLPTTESVNPQMSSRHLRGILSAPPLIHRGNPISIPPYHYTTVILLQGSFYNFNNYRNALVNHYEEYLTVHDLSQRFCDK